LNGNVDTGSALFRHILVCGTLKYDLGNFKGPMIQIGMCTTVHTRTYKRNGVSGHHKLDSSTPLPTQHLNELTNTS